MNWKIWMSAVAVACCLTACGGGSQEPRRDIAATNRAIEAHLQANEVEAAASLLADTPRTQWNARTSALKDETDRRLGALMLADRLKELPAEVDGNQLPRLREISTNLTRDPQELNARFVQLEESVRFLESIPTDDLTPLQASARERLKAGIIQQQRRLMPAFRRSYAVGLDSRLWDNDIRVSAVGTGAETIRFVGYLFASNSNVRPVQEANIHMLTRLRFKRTQYRWHTDSDTLSFSLETPKDDELGYWNGIKFTPVN